MKSCDEMAKNIIRRVEDYEVKKQHKQKMIFRTALSLTSLCIVALIGFGVWNFRNKGINNDYINENNNYVSEENNYVSEKNDYDNEESFNGYEVIKMNSDRIVYNSFDELLEDAELVIIGEVAENPEQNLEYSYSRDFKKDILTDATTYAKVKVLKVLEGEIDKDEVVVKQRCGLLEDEKQLVTFSEMTPLV
jgi:predicted nucleic acid-binding Zn ribbon protein